MKISKEDASYMWIMCQRTYSCSDCEFNPDTGKNKICPNRDSMLVYAMAHGYRKESEVIKDTVSEVVKIINNIYLKKPWYSQFEKDFGREIFEAIDEKFKDVGVDHE